MRKIAHSLSTLRHALASSLPLAAFMALFTVSASAQLAAAGSTDAPRPKYIPGQTLHSVPGVRSSQTPQKVLDGTALRVGHYEPTNMLRLAIILVPPHPVEEGQFLEQLQDKKSPQFHQYLTPAEWTARFGPSVEDEQAVADWARSQGFTITYRSKHRMVVDVEAPAGLIEKVLGVTINTYQVPNADGTAGELKYSADRDPLLPSGIAAVVGSVQGLNSFERVYPASGREPNVAEPDYVAGPAVATQWTAKADAKPATAGTNAEATGLAPEVSAPNSGFYQPSDIWSTGGYDYLALMNQGHCCNPFGNSGQSPYQASIAIAGYDPLSLSDIQNFQAYFSYLAYNIQTIGVDGGLSCSPSAGTCGGEASLDNEWAIATSNSRGAGSDTAKVYYYNAPNGNATDVWTHIMDDGNARVMSSSWGGGEPNTTNSSLQAEDSILATMAGEGWTLLFSSGDQGSTGTCSDALKVIYPASDPNVIAVGGTTLQAFQRTEVGWTGGTSAGSCSPANNHGGSTGGFSDVWPAPGFQSYFGYANRSVPDMALNASIGQDVYVNNGWAYLGGTSIATPMLAGFMAQENAYLLSLGDVCGTGKQSCGTLGDVNYALYTEGYYHDAAHVPFYDITSGCSTNDITAEYPNLVAWCATNGFDQVTGWGSANMLQLAWAINWQDTAAYYTPTVAFSGPATSTWYNTNQNVSWTVVDNTGSADYNGTGIAGFNQSWDTSFTDSTTQPSSFYYQTPPDTFFDGPEFKNGSTGCLALAGGQPCAGGVSQGCHTAHVLGFNNQGETTGDATYGPVCYDTVVPTTTLATSPDVSGGLYTNQSVTATLSAADPGGNNASGIAHTYYGLDTYSCQVGYEGNCHTYTGGVVISSQGTHYIDYFSIDHAGNYSSLGALYIYIDKTAPTTTIGLSGTLVGNYFQSAVKVTLTSADTGGSGVNVTSYKIDGGTLSNYSGPFNVSTPGNHTVTYYSTDYAGNIEATNTYSFGIQSPTSTSLAVSSPSTSLGSPVTLTANVMPTLGGGTFTGSVTFYNSSTNLGTATLSGNVASLVVSNLPFGSNSLHAVYAGATYYVTSTSTIVTETITPGLSITPGSLTFASTPVGTATAAQTITLTNVGTTPVTFTAATTLTGPGAASFTRANVNCTSPLPAGASCSNTIVFKPSTSGALTATVTYSDSGSPTVQSVSLSGTGTSSGPTLSITPGSLTFASTPVGTSTAAQAITLTNTGTTPITFTATTTITGPGATSFSRTNVNCASPLAAGASCTNNVIFKPTTSGTLTATVTYFDSGSATPQTVSVTGTGAGSGSALSISPGALTFATTPVGTTTAAQIITLTNTGTTPITFTASTTVTGSGATSFTRTNVNCASPLAAGASCTNSVVFKPTTSGTLTATINYSDSASTTLQTVSVTGTGGSASALSITPGSLTFATTPVGTTTAAQIITLTNTGTTPITFTATTTITGSGATSFIRTNVNCASPLAAGASCTNSVVFKPTTTGAISATINYSDSASATLQTVNVSGTGQ